jgi:hypothetical protein
MKFSFTFLAVLIISFQSSQSQTPQYYNYNSFAGPNLFPFVPVQGKMVQWIVLPGEFNQPASAHSGNITSFSVMMAGTDGPATYTNLFILMGQTTLTSLPTGQFYTGQMDTVYKRASKTLSDTVGAWLTFILDTPHPYDSTKSLVIQIEQCGVTGSSATMYVAQTLLSGNRRTFSAFNAPCPWAYFSQQNNVLNCGITIGPPVGIVHSGNIIPSLYSLEQNYPNPFNPATDIKFAIPKDGFVKMIIYDVLGNEVKTLINEFKQAGVYTVNFDASALSSGVYFYKIESGTFVDTKKMLMIK